MTRLAIREPTTRRESTPTPRSVATLERAFKQYGEIVALDGVDLEVRQGEVLALLGPNGAGKTTVVKLLIGLVKPDAGHARLFDGDPTSSRSRLRLGAMLQVSKVPETLRVREHIELFSSYYNAPRPLGQCLSIAGLDGLEERRYGELSGGQQQRLLFALAFCGNPQLLILDEPTVGLDVETRRSMWREIRRFVTSGGTILLTTHYLEEADALADRIVVMHQGSVLSQGTPAEIKAQAAGRRIKCLSKLSAEDVEHLPSVLRARRDGASLEVLASDGDAAVRQLMALDPSLSAIEVSSAGLEEAFLALTEAAANPILPPVPLSDLLSRGDTQ